MRYDALFNEILKCYLTGKDDLADADDLEEERRILHWISKLHYKDDDLEGLDLSRWESPTVEDMSEMWFYVVKLWRKYDRSTSGNHQ